MELLARTGRSSAKVAVDARESLGSSRTGVVLLTLGALCPVGSVLTGLCRIQPNLAYASTAVLGLAAMGIGLGWPWARLLGRVAAWLNVFLFAMLVVPDWDDAVRNGSQGLHIACGVVAGYFLLCAIALGFKAKALV